jgi:SAM-dependent methyltransferase
VRRGEFDRRNDNISAFSSRQAQAYSNLLPTYLSRFDMLQSIHAVVLDRVLDGLDRNATVLEVGCGAGSSLELISNRGFVAEGIDVSPDMANAARNRTRCPVICADFLSHEIDKKCDLVFAQAFVHLFPKTMALRVIARLQSLALKRIFFSTSLADSPSEGWEEKDGVVRYRSRYNTAEFMNLVELCVSGMPWRATHFDVPDPLGKNWLDVILYHD